MRNRHSTPTEFSPFATPVTDQFGSGLTHQVVDRYIAQNADGGHMFTLCGERIVPAPMASPAGKSCPECESQIGHLGRNPDHDQRPDT